MLQWTWGHRYLFKILISVSLGIHSEVRLLSHMVLLFLSLRETSILLSLVVASIYIPINTIEGSKSSTSSPIFIATAKSLQSCPTLRDPIDGSPPESPWDSPGKNTGVGCHFLLQCMKVKSESEVAQSCPTLSDPMDCSWPGSSVHGIFQARVLEWGAIVFSGQYLLSFVFW